MLRGVLLGFLGYAVYACGDAIIKSFGAGSDVFRTAFFITLFSAIPLLFARPAGERWRDAFRMRHPVLVHVRAFAGIFAGLFGIYGFTHLPLAEAYALIFLMPLCVTLMSAVFLKEPIGWRRWLAVAVGFAGVMIVVRPGFRELHFAHLGGVAVAFLGATAMIALRRISGDEKRTSLLAVVWVYAMLVNGALMLPHFTWPGGSELFRYAVIGCCAGIGNLCIIAATRLAPANRIAPTQYSQVAWAVALGALFYGEVPDIWTITGLVVIAGAGLFTFVREEARLGPRRRLPTMLRWRI